MHVSLATALAILSLIAYADAYRYTARPKETGTTVVKGVFILVFLILAALCVRVIAIVRLQRPPYIVLLVAPLLSAYGLFGSIVYDLSIANRDPQDIIPGDASPIAIVISTLFTNWGVAFAFLAFAHLIQLRADIVIRSFSTPDKPQTGLSRIWTIAYLTFFALIMIFGTAVAGAVIGLTWNVFDISRGLRLPNISQMTDTYRNLLYTYNAIRYASAILLGTLAFVAYRTEQRVTGMNDKIMERLLFVAFPIHVAYIIAQVIFTVLDSLAGLRKAFENVDNLNLSNVIVSLTLQAATIAVLIFVGLHRSKRNQGGKSTQPGGKGEQTLIDHSEKNVTTTPPAPSSAESE